jgi:hypothetical protein
MTWAARRRTIGQWTRQAINHTKRYALKEPLLPRKRRKCYILCVCVCVCVCVCACGLSYPACNAHAPYSIVICGLTAVPCFIFSQIISQTAWFSGGKKVTAQEVCVLIFSTTCVWNVSHFTKNLARYYYKCTYVFPYSTRYFSKIVTKLEFSQHIFRKKAQTSIFVKIRPAEA